ncbi:ABC transporter permease [Pseudidiomarina sp.]|uniref:ABC transporter permease n=1 Tax=Pseudidiomarina sp. TaxID=2081707 RepID=UPI00299E5EC8|nr:ABC transporter permease [Pseudidiomarina sp.]MDX1706435.1 ABC transporter permease [Pseudidiomarina sp.]
MMIKLAFASLWNRRASAWLTVLAISISVVLLLGVERVREQTKDNFANTISGTDLIVGPRTGSTQLLLSSVFHIGALNNTLSWDSYTELTQLPGVAWHIPLALGDSVRGFPVVATTTDFFEHFRYGDKQPLNLTSGQPFADETQAVLGAEVAEKLGLTSGDELVVSHGSGGLSFKAHDAHPFVVSGVLQRTGTPTDVAVYIPLAGLGLVHGEYIRPDEHTDHDHGHGHGHDEADEPPVYTLSAVLLGLESKPLALRLQRQINTYKGEPLTAIMPGMALQEFWKTLRLLEQALLAISVLVVATGLLGMLTTLLASLRERRREMAVLRSVGAGPGTIFGLLISEALLLTLFGIAIGVGLLYLIIVLGGNLIQDMLGITLSASAITVNEWYLMAAILIAAALLSLFPAWRAYRNALADGLSVKL